MCTMVDFMKFVIFILFIYIVTDCKPPTTEISLEQSEYVVDEGIGKLNRALQVCFVSTDLLIGVNLNLNTMNGSAIGTCVNYKLFVSY